MTWRDTFQRRHTDSQQVHLLLFSRSVVSDSLWPHGLPHARPPCLSTFPGVCSNSCHWVSDAIQPPRPLLYMKGAKPLGASQVALVVKNLAANAGDARDVGLIPGSRKPLGGVYGNPLQYSCLENPMDRGAWWATVHGGRKELDKTEWAQTSLVLRERQIKITMRYHLTPVRMVSNEKHKRWQFLGRT